MKILFSIIIAFSSTTILIAQKFEDIDLILNTDFNTKKAHEISYGFSENPSKITLFNPLYHILSVAMWTYQKLISPQLASECSFNPSCSAYSKQLIDDFGIIKGIIFTTDRIMRCNRVALMGIQRSSDGKIHETTNRYSSR